MQFQNQSVIITGGSSGIGRATAIEFAKRGANVLISDINAEAGESTVSTIRDNGGTAHFFKADVSKVEEVDALVDKAVEYFGGLHHMINNAGIGHEPVPTHLLGDKAWDKVIAINQTGVFYGMRAALRVMKPNKKGNIINVASLAGYLSFPLALAYSATKFAVVGMTKTAAVEYGASGIRINAVCPGMVETPLTDNLYEVSPPKFKEMVMQSIAMKRFGQPEEIAKTICWLSSEDASYMNGVALRVDGGMRV